MSDVLHRARYTPSELAQRLHAQNFRAKIAARAWATPVVVEVKQPEPISEPVPVKKPAFRWNGAAVCSCNACLGVPATPIRPKIETIQRAVCDRYLISLTDMLSSRRTAATVRPRHVAMYLARILTLRSLPEIGRLFNHRDHTTVLSAVRKIANARTQDGQFDALLKELTALLVPGETVTVSAVAAG